MTNPTTTETPIEPPGSEPWDVDHNPRPAWYWFALAGVVFMLAFCVLPLVLA